MSHRAIKSDMRNLIILFFILTSPIVLLSQQKINEITMYFPFSFFPKVNYVYTNTDSSSILVSTYYEISKEKSDTIKAYAKKIPNQYDTSVVERYSKYLTALQEPVVYSDTSNYEIYRFTWLRTFKNPIAVRITKKVNEFRIYWKVSDGAGGFEPGKLIIDKNKKISKGEWDKFQTLLIKMNYWNLDNIPDEPFIDGSHWILEGRTQNQYSVVDKRSPNQESYYWKCCYFLIELTNLKNIKGDIK